MRLNSPAYGRRGRLGDANTGIRSVAPTFGKRRLGSFSEKASGHYTVESAAEQCLSHLLTLDPRITAFQPQPFSVDLIDERVLRTKEALHIARYRHRHIEGAKFYTPDFSLVWSDGRRHALEVKVEGYEGDADYWDKLEIARPILAANNHPLLSVVIPRSTAHPIRANVRVLKQAFSHIPNHLSEALISRITQCCESGPITVHRLCAELSLQPGLIPVLLVSGVLSADIAHQRINGELPISLAYGDLSHLHLLEAVQR